MKKLLSIGGLILIIIIGYFVYSFYFKSVGMDTYGRYVGPGCQIQESCNGPISCGDKKLNQESGGSICMYSPELSCYLKAGMRCEKQESGKCDWTNTEALSVCINETRSQQLKF